MNFIKKIWSWKFRILIITLLIMEFVSNYSKGIFHALSETLFIYAVYSLGQFTADEIKKASEK